MRRQTKNGGDKRLCIIEWVLSGWVAGNQLQMRLESTVAVMVQLGLLNWCMTMWIVTGKKVDNRIEDCVVESWLSITEVFALSVAGYTYSKQLDTLATFPTKGWVACHVKQVQGRMCYISSWLEFSRNSGRVLVDGLVPKRHKIQNVIIYIPWDVKFWEDARPGVRI